VSEIVSQTGHSLNAYVSLSQPSLTTSSSPWLSARRPLTPVSMENRTDLFPPARLKNRRLTPLGTHDAIIKSAPRTTGLSGTGKQYTIDCFFGEDGVSSSTPSASRSRACPRRRLIANVCDQSKPPRHPVHKRRLSMSGKGLVLGSVADEDGCLTKNDDVRLKLDQTSRSGGDTLRRSEFSITRGIQPENVERQRSELHARPALMRTSSGQPKAKRRQTFSPSSSSSDFNMVPFTPLSPPIHPPSSFTCADDTQARDELLTFSDLLDDYESGVSSFCTESKIRSPTRTSVTQPNFLVENVYSQEPLHNSPLLETFPAKGPSGNVPGPQSDQFDSPFASGGSPFWPVLDTIPADYSLRKSDDGPEPDVCDSSPTSPSIPFHPIMETIPADYSPRKSYSIKHEARLVDEIHTESPEESVTAYHGCREIKQEGEEALYHAMVIDSSPDPLPQIQRSAMAKGGDYVDVDEKESLDDAPAHGFQPPGQSFLPHYRRSGDVGTGRDDDDNDNDVAPDSWALGFQPVGDTILADGGPLDDFQTRELDGERGSSKFSDVKSRHRVTSSAQLRLSLQRGFEDHDRLPPRQLTLSGMWGNSSPSSAATRKEEGNSVAADADYDEAKFLAAHLRRQRALKSSNSIADHIVRDCDDDDTCDIDDDARSTQTVVSSSQTQHAPSLANEREPWLGPTGFFISSSQTQHVQNFQYKQATQVVESSQTQTAESLECESVSQIVPSSQTQQFPSLEESA
jgi:hypothetical protein